MSAAEQALYVVQWASRMHVYESMKSQVRGSQEWVVGHIIEAHRPSGVGEVH